MTQLNVNANQPPDPLHELGLALLELLDRPIILELEHPDDPAALALHGTLLRAFDPPNPTAPPTLTLMIGAHCINIRLSPIKQASYNRKKDPKHKIDSIHLLLVDQYNLHIKHSPTNHDY